MTDEQINRKIAEAVGWESETSERPNCAGCLNAIHNAEQTLWSMDWNKRYVFNDNLANIIKGKTVNRNEWSAETLLHATARQRAEAFLRTLGKWEGKA